MLETIMVNSLLIAWAIGVVIYIVGTILFKRYSKKRDNLQGKKK